MKRFIIICLCLGMCLLPTILYAGSSAWRGSTNTEYWTSDSGDLYYELGDVAVGTTNRHGALTVEGEVAVDEIAEPSLTAGYGKFYASTADGKAYFKASDGTNYDLTAGGGTGAPTDGSYVTMSAVGSLTSERVLTAGDGITVTDGGANTTVTLSIANDAIKDSMIDWGSGAGQVDTDDVPEGSNKYYDDALARLAISTTATGLTYTSGTGVLSLTAGYVIPTTTQETNWNGAYTLKTTLDALSGILVGDGGGGYTAITDGTANWNDAYTKRVDTWSAPLGFAGNTASITQAGAAADGYLSSTDWNTFDGKEDVLTFSNGVTRTLNDIENDLITGVSGGQIVIGGTDASDDLILKSTGHATRGIVASLDPIVIGETGRSGYLVLFSDQSPGTSYTAALYPNSAMTSDASFYLPADEPGATYLLNMTTGGVMGYDTSTYLTAEADTLADVTGRGASTTTASTFAGNLTVGASAGSTGQISFVGTTSGTAILKTSDVAGTPTIVLPTSAGTLALTTDIPGSQDLDSVLSTGDTSAANNLTLTAGTLTANTITDGTFSVTGGTITGAAGSNSQWTNDEGYLTAEADTLADVTGRGATTTTATTLAGNLTVGAAAGSTGQVSFAGTTSGTTILKAADAAGAATLTLPTAQAGSNNLALISSTAGVLSFNDQALLTTSTPQFARVGLGQAADAGAVMAATGQYFSAKKTDTVVGSTWTTNWNEGNVHYIVLGNGAHTAPTLSNPKDGARYMLILKQPASDAAGTVTWPAAMKFPGGVAPTLTTDNNAVDIITLVYDATNSVYYCGSSLDLK